MPAKKIQKTASKGKSRRLTAACYYTAQALSFNFVWVHAIYAFIDEANGKVIINHVGGDGGMLRYTVKLLFDFKFSRISEYKIGVISKKTEAENLVSDSF